MLSRFHLIPERHGQTDRQTDRRTELLYQYRASVCWRAIKIGCISLSLPRYSGICHYHFRGITVFLITVSFSIRPNICHTEITDNGMKVWNLVSWLSGKSLKLLPPDVRYFKSKMYQIQFRLGHRPRPRWGSLQRSPRPTSWIKGPTSKGGVGRRREGEGRGREEEPRGREGTRPHPFTPPWSIFLDTLLDWHEIWQAAAASNRDSVGGLSLVWW